MKGRLWSGGWRVGGEKITHITVDKYDKSRPKYFDFPSTTHIVLLLDRQTDRQTDRSLKGSLTEKSPQFLFEGTE